MKKYLTPITEALTEAGKPTTIDTAKLKKLEMAAFAEKEIAGTGWLPEHVRISAIEAEEMGFSLDDESDRDKEGSAS